jgi:uncharacterized membrane protein
MEKPILLVIYFSVSLESRAYCQWQEFGRRSTSFSRWTGNFLRLAVLYEGHIKRHDIAKKQIQIVKKANQKNREKS